jgi:hypothetical protein
MSYFYSCLIVLANANSRILINSNILVFLKFTGLFLVRVIWIVFNWFYSQEKFSILGNIKYLFTKFISAQFFCINKQYNLDGLSWNSLVSIAFAIPKIESADWYLQWGNKQKEDAITDLKSYHINWQNWLSSNWALTFPW